MEEQRKTGIEGQTERNRQRNRFCFSKPHLSQSCSIPRQQEENTRLEEAGKDSKSSKTSLTIGSKAETTGSAHGGEWV